MGEMDLGDLQGAPLDSETATAEQLTRDERAEQLRAEARAQLDPPSHFATPAWLGPSSRERAPQVVPVQSEPSHDELAQGVHAYAPTPVDDAVPDAAHWVEHQKPRLFIGLLLTVALLGAVASLVFAVTDRSVVAIVSLAGCAILAVIFRGALMGSGLTTVDLKGSTLKVRQDGELSVFNLADPATRVETSGTPGSGGWKAVLESIDHREITLTPAHVHADEFDRVVTYYRQVAERERQDRYNRFNR